MARVAKEDREYYAVLDFFQSDKPVDQIEYQTESLPRLLRHLFPTALPNEIRLEGRLREAYFNALQRGGAWPNPNFHTVARDLRLAPHLYQRIFEIGGAFTLQVTIKVRDTSQMRAYRNSGFLDDDQIDRVVAQLVGTDKDHEAELVRIYPGLPLEYWREGISALQFARVVEKDSETGLWQLTK